MKAESFHPNWASAPGETIADILHEQNLSPQEFARRIGWTTGHVNQLLRGHAKLTMDIAIQLGRFFGVPETFWLEREAQYRQGLVRLEQELNRDGNEWLSEIPLKDMIRFGWITDSSNPISVSLRFFGVSSIAEWRDEYSEIVKTFAFRTSPSFKSDVAAVAAWLRQGEILANHIKCQAWDAKCFREVLPTIRRLTRRKTPDSFIPELRKLCAECGVATVVLRAPTRCRASGATRFLSAHKALLLLSFRYLSDDHFWFTFFHEAGHLLLHGHESLFLEDTGDENAREEREANEFAAKLLIPHEFGSDLQSVKPDAFQIIEFAHRIGIAPGIVVGQLQHSGKIQRYQFNNLKRRFVWSS